MKNHEDGFYFVKTDKNGEAQIYPKQKSKNKFEILAKFMVDKGHAKKKEQELFDDKQTFKILCALRKELKDALNKIKELQAIIDAKN